MVLTCYVISIILYAIESLAALLLLLILYNVSLFRVYKLPALLFDLFMYICCIYVFFFCFVPSPFFHLAISLPMHPLF